MGNLKNEEYYLGLDVGTSSLGYAVTDVFYRILKHGGEPMWGSHVFEEGKTAKGRRSFRTSRRRLARKKQRVQLVTELFAEEILKVDPRFFIRRRESALLREDVSETDRSIVFNDDNFKDRQYYEQFPTMHHLIYALMTEDRKFDLRLIYMACAYLVAHRGHFLSEVSKDNIKEVLDFDKIYKEFQDQLVDFSEKQFQCNQQELCDILRRKSTITKKEKELLQLLNQGKKFKTTDEEAVSFECVVKLFSGGKVELGKLFPQLELEEKQSFSLSQGDEEFAAILAMSEEYAELLRAMRNVYDWSILSEVLSGKDSISAAKVAVYNQHKEDLKFLKRFIKTYLPGKYYSVFRSEKEKNNYLAYSANLKSLKTVEQRRQVRKKATKEEFSDYLRKLVSDITVAEEDQGKYEDMLTRLQTFSFLPKQVDSDNRVIPYQLNYYELKMILEKAKKYYPFLKASDADGYSTSDKILSIMEFRIPYYVGPLRKDNGTHGWLIRKAEGKIYPWNFKGKIDLEQSEEAFIRRMTNQCTYLVGEDTLPKHSLLYSKYVVLNEINNIRVNQQELPIEHKQGIYRLFQENKKVTVKRIREYLIANRLMNEGDDLSGLDIKINSELKSYHNFRRILEKQILSESQVERIIERLTLSDDKNRMQLWLLEKFPELSEEDCKYISGLKYNDFGRFSKRFLSEIKGCYKETGEVFSIIEGLWNTNCNLMQLLSKEFDFTEQIEAINAEYYQAHPVTLDEKLDALYLNNSVRRAIYRVLDVVKDICKATGKAPTKIFVEMARGGGEKGVRTKSRRDQILELYKNMDKNEVRELSRELEGKSDNELQSEVLFLYFMQLGKSAYSDTPIDINRLKTKLYDVDHIYPRAYVKDDSLTNKVLVLSTENGAKKDQYPIASEIREKQAAYWHMLLKNKLISEEKYRRLTRNKPFTDAENQGFINRQLVVTRQSTKALIEILRSIYPNTEIVFSKAENVSEFRKEFDMLKCRSVNDLHHAKDAYLNIVVGNVYHNKFTKHFYIEKKYSLKTETIFKGEVKDGDICVWNGEKSLAEIRKVMNKNNIHYTKFSFYRRGGLFDQMPVKASTGLVPRKKGLDTAVYGGYYRTTATGFMVVQYKEKGKQEAMMMPVELLYEKCIKKSQEEAVAYTKKTLETIWGKEGEITDIKFPIGRRLLRVNTVLSFDGFKVCVAGKESGGKQIGLSSLEALIIGGKWEAYVKRLDSYVEKQSANKKIALDEEYDEITREKNIELYDILSQKVIPECAWFHAPFDSQVKVLEEGRLKFEGLPMENQVVALLGVVQMLKSGRAGAVNLSLIGGSDNSAKFKVSSKISLWKKKYQQVDLLDCSASGIYQKKVINLLELLE